MKRTTTPPTAIPIADSDDVPIDKWWRRYTRRKYKKQDANTALITTAEYEVFSRMLDLYIDDRAVEGSRSPVGFELVNTLLALITCYEKSHGLYQVQMDGEKEQT